MMNIVDQIRQLFTGPGSEVKLDVWPEPSRRVRRARARADRTQQLKARRRKVRQYRKDLAQYRAMEYHVAGLNDPARREVSERALDCLDPNWRESVEAVD